MTGGWAIGYVVAAAVVVVVALVVLAIIALARRVARQAEQATRAIEEARDHTEALWLLDETRRRLGRVLRALRGAEQTEPSGPRDYNKERVNLSEESA